VPKSLLLITLREELWKLQIDDDDELLFTLLPAYKCPKSYFLMFFQTFKGLPTNTDCFHLCYSCYMYYQSQIKITRLPQNPKYLRVCKFQLLLHIFQFILDSKSNPCIFSLNCQNLVLMPCLKVIHTWLEQVNHWLKKVKLHHWLKMVKLHTGLKRLNCITGLKRLNCTTGLKSEPLQGYQYHLPSRQPEQAHVPVPSLGITGTWLFLLLLELLY
jgi:hypothetical protein